MFTTGSKWFLGLGLVTLVLAAAYGWATGGSGFGPVSGGYNGAVGDHFGYALLLSLGLLSVFLGLVVVAVRDADAGALAQVAGTETAPAAVPPAHLAYWPIAGAFGAVLVVLGLVISNVLFIAGFIVLLAVLVEWMVLAWSDRATGDPETNRLVRDRLLGPYEVPLTGILLAGGTVAALSRVFLAATELGAVAAGTIVGTIVFGLGALLASRPKLSSNVVAGVLVLAAAGVVTAGVVAAARGERDIEPHETHHEEAPAEGDEQPEAPSEHEAPAEGGLRPLVPEGTEHSRADHHGGRGLTRTPSDPIRRPRRWRAALVLPILLALTACAEHAPLDTLEPKGPEARSIDRLSDPVFLIAGIVFVFVQGGVLFLAWRFRKRKEDDDSLPSQVHGHTLLELTWTILPALLLAGVGGASVLTILDLDDTPDDAMEVTVIGQQWWWEYRYDVDGDGTDDIITANDLVIPAGVPVSLTITSRDVIHSFWIPALNGKRDAVPNREHSLVLEADEPGVYRGQCTEFCGLSHGYMRMRAVALDEDDFAAWRANQLEGAQDPTGALAEEGQEIFRTTCSQCHRVRGPGGNDEQFKGAALVSGAAPDLTHFASRGVFAGSVFDLWVDQDDNGEVDLDELGAANGGRFNVADLQAWLHDPPGQKPMYPQGGRGMPNLELTQQQIDALVAFLETLE